MFNASIYVEVGDGGRALFWSDRWIGGHSIQDIAPCLCNTVGVRVKKQRTVAQALQDDRWIRDISGALTVQVILEYLHVWDLTREIQLADCQNDRICWMWTLDKVFSTSLAYRAFFIGQHPLEGAKILQKTSAPTKCKFFIWLVLHDRCWTTERRKRHGLQDQDTCVLCIQESEMIDHLLVNCSFTREIWFRSLRWLGWETVAPTNETQWLAEWWVAARKRIPKEVRKTFDSMVTLTCWIV